MSDPIGSLGNGTHSSLPRSANSPFSPIKKRPNSCLDSAPAVEQVRPMETSPPETASMHDEKPLANWIVKAARLKKSVVHLEVLEQQLRDREWKFFPQSKNYTPVDVSSKEALAQFETEFKERGAFWNR